MSNPNESESVARVVYRSTELTTKSPAPVSSTGQALAYHKGPVCQQAVGATFFVKDFINFVKRINLHSAVTARNR